MFLQHWHEHCCRYTLCWYGSSRVWTRRYVRLYNIDVKTASSARCMGIHVFSVVWRMSGLPYDYFRETHWISMRFREINMVSLVNMHGPIWQTFETISVRNPCRLFQKYISAARHGRPSRPALTNFWNKRRPILPSLSFGCICINSSTCIQLTSTHKTCMGRNSQLILKS